MFILHQKEPTFILSLEVGAAKLMPACLEEVWSTGRDGHKELCLCLRYMVADEAEEEEIWLWS